MNNITDIYVRAFPLEEPRGNLLGFANVTLNDCFAVSGIRILNGEGGPFIAMPGRKDSRGEYRDVCFPVTAGFRRRLNDAVLEEYNNIIENGPRENPSVKEQLAAAQKAVRKAAKSAPAHEEAR